jgi:hypothetical protein
MIAGMMYLLFIFGFGASIDKLDLEERMCCGLGIAHKHRNHGYLQSLYGEFANFERYCLMYSFYIQNIIIYIIYHLTNIFILKIYKANNQK